MRKLDLEVTYQDYSLARGDHDHLLWVEYLADHGYAPELNEVWILLKVPGILRYTDKKLPFRWLHKDLRSWLDALIVEDWEKQCRIEKELRDARAYDC